MRVTSYQLNSLRAFHIGCNARGNGSFYGEQNFETEEEAKAYLTNIAENYFENESDLQEAIADIERGALTIDAVTAHIEEEEFYVIGIFAGSSEEYWAGQLGRLCDSEFEAARYDSVEDASEVLEDVVKPYGESQDWFNVTYKII